MDLDTSLTILRWLLRPFYPKASEEELADAAEQLLRTKPELTSSTVRNVHELSSEIVRLRDGDDESGWSRDLNADEPSE